MIHQLFYPGGEITITCTADNLPDPQFLWYKNGFQFSASDAEQISLTAVCIVVIAHNPSSLSIQGSIPNFPKIIEDD